ncbi:hypothetical protein L541_0239 [Bordetella hinzii CA90 BAL1384]|uniref:Uncharacterized protein n=1 Tax=Bordetella hinzii OH87 BAL007II TaxID=1331262 RepID=A0ABR4QYF9_9BORD|nr:hypothetical protein L543_0217 [Bordetella hinzii L60]KCB23256.1 hypothetical protein L544_0197 [Bordetella hinzii OH87 BAL007II]KCB26934.1 hypothetical protein L541_0239 [Bordetella hinzii CA90 BAL1384]KCB42762.1 hypothetical protein L539_0200 [Bordetella hinzii 5132]KCB47111.1 hypothetical protein L537_0205 [Bordetella hinzii 1277]
MEASCRPNQPCADCRHRTAACGAKGKRSGIDEVRHGARHGHRLQGA